MTTARYARAPQNKLGTEFEMTSQARPSSEVRALVLCLTSCMAFLATSFASNDGWAQTKTNQLDDLQSLIDEVESLASQVEDVKAKRLIEARLIGIQYLRGEKEAATAAWEDLLESVLDFDGATEPDRIENRFDGGVQVSSFAGRQLRLGNQPLAMMALDQLDGTVGSFFCYINLILAAGDRNDLELAKKLFEQAKADESVQFASRRNFGMNLEGALVHAHIRCGDLDGALNTLKQLQPKDVAGSSPVAQKLQVAASAVQVGKSELAERLLRPILESLGKNQNGLQFKSQFIQANMLWAKLYPSEFQRRLGSCLEMLETHEGVNGPEGGYYALVSHLVEMGRFDLATQALDKLKQENMQQRAFKKIAICQAEQGNLMEAQTTLDSIHVESIKLEAELSIAKKAFGLGKRERAKQILADSIDRALDSFQKQIPIPSSFLLDAAKLQTQWKQKEKALDWVRAISDRQVKADCLLAMIELSLAEQ